MNSKQHHHVESVDFADENLILRVDGKTHRFPLEEVSLALASASKSDRLNFRVSPSGYGIHWEELDEDLSIDALLGISHSPTARAESVSLTREAEPDYPSENRANTRKK